MENPAIQLSLEGLKVLLQALTGKQLNNVISELGVDDIVNSYYEEEGMTAKDSSSAEKKDWILELVEVVKDATELNPKGIKAEGINLAMKQKHGVVWDIKGITGRMRGFMHREPKIHKTERGWYAYNDEA